MKLPFEIEAERLLEEIGGVCMPLKDWLAKIERLKYLFTLHAIVYRYDEARMGAFIKAQTTELDRLIKVDRESHPDIEVLKQRLIYLEARIQSSWLSRWVFKMKRKDGDEFWKPSIWKTRWFMFTQWLFPSYTARCRDIFWEETKK